jgi:starvation-inducible DNA-binding protein
MMTPKQGGLDMRVVARHDIDGHEVTVVQQHEADDSPYFELSVDGTPMETERFPSPPEIETIRRALHTTAQPIAPAGVARQRRATIDIGLNDAERLEIAEGLAALLADTYTLYLKTHNYHWNVTGPMFHTLHLMFEQQYTELALAVDLIAERIRALGVRAPGTYREFSARSSIPEDGDEPDATEMIRRLVDGQESVVRTARAAFPAAASAHDEPTADLLTQRMQVHEKTAWMLRSLLE